MRNLSRAAAAVLALAMSGTAAAQHNATFHQNCAMQATLASDLIGRDPRSVDAPERAAVETSMRRFADAHEAAMRAQLEAGYEQAAALGWDRARVDAEHARIGEATYAAHVAPVMEAGRIKADLVMALNTCATQAPGAWGQSQEALVGALEQLLRWAQG